MSSLKNKSKWFYFIYSPHFTRHVAKLNAKIQNSLWLRIYLLFVWIGKAWTLGQGGATGPGTARCPTSPATPTSPPAAPPSPAAAGSGAQTAGGRHCTAVTAAALQVRGGGEVSAMGLNWD